MLGRMGVYLKIIILFIEIYRKFKNNLSTCIYSITQMLFNKPPKTYSRVVRIGAFLTLPGLSAAVYVYKYRVSVDLKDIILYVQALTNFFKIYSKVKYIF